MDSMKYNRIKLHWIEYNWMNKLIEWNGHSVERLHTITILLVAAFQSIMKYKPHDKKQMTNHIVWDAK